MFCYILGRFPVGRVCSAMSRVDFWSAKCVLPHPGTFPAGSVCSAMSRVDFWSPRSSSIFGQQSVFCHSIMSRSISGQQSVFCYVLGRFPVIRVCSTMFQVNFWSAECVPPRPGFISSRQSVFCRFPGQFLNGRVRSSKLRAHYILFPKICGHTDTHTDTHTEKKCDF